MRIRWLWDIDIVSILLPLIAGTILTLLVLLLGPISLPVVIFVLILLPWFLKDVFRLFIWLIITWPILTLYFRLPLPAGIPDLSYERSLISLLLCIVIFEALFSKRRLLKPTSLDILVLGYIIAQLSSRLFVLWFGGIGKPDLNGLLDNVLIPVLLYWIAKNLLSFRVNLKWFLYALVIASLLICLTGLYEQTFHVNVFRAGKYLWLDMPGGRAEGVMENPAIYGATLGMGVLAGICSLYSIKSKTVKAALIITIAVLLYGVFASYTRSAWVPVFTVLFAAQFFVGDLWKRSLPIFVLGSPLLIPLWNELSASQAFMNRATNMGNIVQRLSLVRVGWEMFLERPFLGWGSGALNIIGLSQAGAISHNIYISFLADGGLVLFLSFMAVAGYILIKAIRVYAMTEKGSFERNILVTLTGCILIFLLTGLGLELRYFTYFNALFWMCAGVIDGMGREIHG